MTAVMQMPMLGLGKTLIKNSAFKALWTPAALSASSLALWLDADDASTITLNGATVSEWRDKSGNARHASQATASLQPTYNASGTNNKPRIEFSNDEFLLPNGIYKASPALFIVSNRGTDAAVWCRFQNATEVLFVFNHLGTLSWACRRGQSQIAFTYPPRNAVADIYSYDSGVSNGVTWSYHYNGEPLTPTTSLGEAGGLANQNLLGRDAGGGSPFNGSLNEIILVGGNVATETRQRVEGYLAWKWGLVSNLPSNHPFKQFAPRV